MLTYKANSTLKQALALDSGTDDFEVLGSQSEELSDELEDYEVICAADLKSIPAQTIGVRPRAASQVFGQGASFMMK